MKAYVFKARAGAGACSVPGVTAGQTVSAIFGQDPSGHLWQLPTAAYEGTVTVQDQVQQSYPGRVTVSYGSNGTPVYTLADGSTAANPPSAAADRWQNGFADWTIVALVS